MRGFAILIASLLLIQFERTQDTSAAAVWQKLRKLQTTASLMHTTAHPDDEQGGMLAMLSRGLGARTSLLTLTRGESGDNAIGPELFEALGLIRTEELRIAGQYYGLDAQYFGSVTDYGFSKRLDEAFEKWGHDKALADVVRAIRAERPFVIVSRFQGNARDGHGNHQAAGVLTREAFRAAADPARFPDQIAAGLRPWQALKLYMGGVRANEAWTLSIDPGRYDPVLGRSYQALARIGLSFQRSQNSGRVSVQAGPAPMYFARLDIDASPKEAKESSFFDGIDTTYAGLYRTLHRQPPSADAEPLLAAIDTEAAKAIAAFTLTNPAAAVPPLTRGLTATRAALTKLGSDPDIAHVLKLKERQFCDAIAAALGIDLTAAVDRADAVAADRAGTVVPGETFTVRASFLAQEAAREVALAKPGAGPSAVKLRTLEVVAPTGWTSKGLDVTVPPNAAPGRPSVGVRAEFEVDSVIVDTTTSLRELVVLPAIAVSISPKQAIVPINRSGTAHQRIDLTIDLINNQSQSASGAVTLKLPTGWRAEPASLPFTLAPGQHARVSTSVAVTTTAANAGGTPSAGTPTAGAYDIEAIATTTDSARTYAVGYESLAHRDLETQYLFHPAKTSVRVLDVAIAPNLTIGYVMGIGDEVPAAIAQLGATVQLLDERALATAPLDRFNAIILGTRAYAVRPDVIAHNARLLDYAKNGGNLIVFYNTPEFDPAKYAPFPGTLPQDAEEVSEEDAPVTILAPQDPIFTTPNAITAKDFEGWIEQRGSKFWRTWDAAYTPLLECHDRDQPPQRGGWLHARYGKGHYSYVAYAFHRQLPSGVPGAYRLLANLLSLGRR
jgi:LmbE family N-acetylglucosaminyl deacetylase